jgi:hypothetical protein
MGYLFSLSRSATSGWLNASEIFLLLSGIVLVIGLFGEQLPWWHPRLRIFEILVIVGCGGELLADGGVALFSWQLERISNEEIARLNVAIAGRELTSDQQRRIGVALAKYAGRPVWIRSYAGDPEAKRLGREIISALRVAHVDTEDRLEELSSGNPMLFGIEVQCAETRFNNQRDFAFAVIAALSSKDAGNLAVRPLSEFACQSDETTEINVGIRPPTLVE